MSEPTQAQAWWSRPAAELLASLKTSATGLSASEAEARLTAFGPNALEQGHHTTALSTLWAQLRNPMVLLLLFAAGTSGAVREWTDASLVLTIVVATVGIGFWREFSASHALEELKARLSLKSRVLREGGALDVPASTLVPGDIVLLAAGSLIPADGVVLEATDFFVNEAVLTGETYPVEKRPGVSEIDAPISQRANAVFRGTNVRSGTARMLVVMTGARTSFGEIARHLTLRPPETEFDRGLRHFGGLLLRVMLVMTLVVFAANVALHRPVIDALLFSIALAVGLTPELLPAILTVNLGRSAQAMSKKGVLVRRLNAIENLGSMDVLCTDKTGTLTIGVVRLDGAMNPDGAPSEDVRTAAILNARFQSGLPNPLDEAILKDAPALEGAEKLDECPYDFVRKRLSVVVRHQGRIRLITKGAFENVLSTCTRLPGGALLDDSGRAKLRARFNDWSGQGFRVLGVAEADVPMKPSWHREDERDLTFAGFLLFFDPPKEGVAQVISELESLGVDVKIITGDALPVAQHAAAAVGLPNLRAERAADLANMSDDALAHHAFDIDIFAEVDPNQKERIILALRKRGHVVGYMGDGINDAPALHTADVSVSVDNAVDVAREAADFVLLERDLEVLRRGIVEGRRTFANTLKYILMTTSANLGNMISMAIASLALPFLPLLAGQILLNNFLSDVPAFALATDAVDPEMVSKPRRWDVGFLRRFMILFGLLSSVFDFVTFGALLFVFRAGEETFRTGWFFESLLTELCVALVIRTRRAAVQSRPGTMLLVSTAVVALVDCAIPYVPHAWDLGFVPLQWHELLALVLITATYVGSAELLKRSFYAWVDRQPSKLPGTPTLHPKHARIWLRP